MSLRRTFLAACALAATVSQALELDGDVNACGETLAEVENEPVFPGLTKYDRFYFSQKYYDKQTATKKLEELWSMIAPTVNGVHHVEGPQDFTFKDFPQIMEANIN